MKRLFLFILCLTMYALGVMAQATSLTIDNQTPGWLSSKINYGDQLTLENLTVTGYLNTTDLKFIGSLMSKSLNGTIDISDAHFVAGSSSEDDSWNVSPLFGRYGTIRHLKLPITKKGTFRDDILYGLMIDSLTYGGPECRIFDFLFHGNYNSYSSLKHLILREDVDSIAPRACNNYSNGYGGAFGDLQSVVMLGNIKGIGNEAFRKCTKLTSVVLPPSIEYIDEYAFYDTGINPDTLFLPNNLKVFKTRAFNHHQGMHIYVPSATQYIDDTYQYYSINTYRTANDIEPALYDEDKIILHLDSEEPVESSLRTDCIEPLIVYIPKGSMIKYQNSDWKYATLIEEAVDVENVVLNKAEEQLQVGRTMTLYATVLPSNAYDLSVKWSSSDNSVAEVDANGKVTAIKSGVAEISVISNNNPIAYAKCKITVFQPVTDITLNKTESTINVGESLELKATISPYDADNRNVQWTTSNDEIASVDEGKVVGKKAGKVIITAISEENAMIKAECEVTVLQPVTGISLDQTSLKFTYIGSSKQLTATVLPEDASNKNVNWSSSDNSVCMVSQNGTVVSTGRGSAIIIATTEVGGFVAICNITVTTLHKLTYMLDDEEYYSETLEYGTTIVPQDEPTKEGYTFSGWSTIPATMPAENVIINGSFTVNRHDVIYMVDGIEYQRITYDYGTALNLIDAPVKEGWSFSGWSELPAIMPDNDVEINGTFTVNKYMVQYYDNERLLAEFEVEYGAAIPQYEYNNEEVIFEGWEGKVYDTMPAHDIAYYAITTPNGIADIKIDDNAEITVYTLTGLAVYNGRMADLPRGLRGVYIIKYGDKTIKCRL